MASVFALHYRVQVTPNEPLRPADALSIPFVVRNDGYLSMHSVLFLCRIVRLRAVQGEISQSLAGDGKSIQTLGAGDSSVIPCFLKFVRGARIVEADIEVTVVFRHAIYPWRTELDFPFSGLSGSDGRLRFYPRRSN